MPRWSAEGGGHPLATTSIAGLPARGGAVAVAPPFAPSGPSFGSAKVTPAAQRLSLPSVGWSVGHWRLKPPSARVVEQFFWMFHGLPPFAAVLLATIEARSVARLPPTMPPPTQSAWLPTIVTWVRVVG